MATFKESLKKDLEELLGRFQATGTVRYQEFSAVWREMNFSSIFYGCVELGDNNAFTRDILAAASRYFLPPNSFQIRVGALYLLHGLYHSQPAFPQQKIRIALKEWEDIVTFQQEASNAQHYDVVYILWKLRQDKAFCFTAMPIKLNFRSKKKIKPPANCESFIDPPVRPQELMNNDSLEEIANIHQHYEELKAAISAEPGKANSKISLVQQDLVSKVRNRLTAFAHWQKSERETEKAAEEDSEETMQMQECSRRAELLASIKSKSFGQPIEVSRARRHRAITVAAVDTVQGPSRTRRESLKKRTLRCLVGQGPVCEDLLKPTKLWRLTSVGQEEERDQKPKRRFKY
ncbi:snRNA-activating protein complex subunit 1b [Denticeps clupeoides]|uniref:snRNA-activating protein complex subunit 1 n=1 Tax=Denticeps clupeoides TaxID=299321 RepID=A0AAY4B4L3_9TELE|nr:snRNA-activating protein complex subunit 1 [Denticeps clupeoides]